MQTFLPYADFNKTARCLDYRRLGKQRVEAWQILNTLMGNSNGWKNHPAVKMWRGYEYILAYYGMAMCSEWIRRGYNDSMMERFENAAFELAKTNPTAAIPPWMKNRKFHRSHKSNLIRKFPEHYKPMFNNVPDNLSYVWPI